MTEPTRQCEKFVWDNTTTPHTRRQCKHPGKATGWSFLCARHTKRDWDEILRSDELEPRWEKLRSDLLNQKDQVEEALRERWS